ncbi:hypothetical protein [uncultured Flavonifractor sp.]|uniref:hypothetical protein n=1 Tax=uncultured Flavonifractor sp. TaxID=1193534 RepID=UPI0026701134|nr:hypothetical protein [uncultured Flavonifractor sp.]
MRFLLRIVVFPFAIACIVLAAVVRLAAGISGALLEALGGLCLLCALFAWFIQGDNSAALLMLGIAVFFVVQGLLADAVTGGLTSLADVLCGVVFG